MTKFLAEVAVDSCKGMTSFVTSTFPKRGMDLKHEVTVIDDEASSAMTLLFLLF